MLDEEVPEQQPIPVLEIGLDGMDVVRPLAIAVALDEPGVERRSVVSGGRPPEILIALRGQDGDDDALRLVEIAYLEKDVDDRLRCQAGNGRAAEMLDPPERGPRKAIDQVFLLLLEKRRPGRIVLDDLDLFARQPRDLLLDRFERGVDGKRLSRPETRAGIRVPRI